MIISITSLKGGVGKSTLTINLAVLFAHKGYKVAIVDTDTNQSCVKWSSFRDESLPGVPVFGLNDGAELSKNVRLIAPNYDILFIDGTPSLSSLTSKIILLADIVYIPILPGVLDLWATAKFLEHYQNAVEQRESHIPAYFVMNRYKKTTVSSKIRTAIGNSNIQVLESAMNDRVIYSKAVSEGKGVFEMGDEKSKMEVTRLFNEIFEHVKA